MKNLNLNNIDVISWCVEKIKVADKIEKTGKNFYVYKKNLIITINSNNYCIITAHERSK